MLQPSLKRLSFSLIAAIWLILVVAFGAAGFDQYFKMPYLEVGDVAVNALQIDNAKHFRELYGNYSRFEFNHPGPAFFYVYAAGEGLLHDLLKVVPSPGNAHLFSSMCLQSAFFALALGLVVSNLRSSVWIPLALMAAALFFGPFRDPFMSIWPPHVLLMPFLCFLAAGCSIGTGRIAHLPYAVLAGGFLFHGHVAQPLFVGSLGSLALGLAGWRWRQVNPNANWREIISTYRRVFLTCGLLAGLFILPLLIDLASGGTRSNVATIIGRFSDNTHDAKTVVQSFLYFVSFATTAQNQSEIFTTLGPQVREFFGQNAGHLIFWGCILVLTPGLAWVAPSRPAPTERRFLLTMHVFVVAAIGGCVLWGMAQAGPMEQFNGYFYYAIYFFAFLAALGWLDCIIQPVASAPFLSAIWAISAIAFTWSFRLPRLGDFETGMPAQRAIESALGATASRPKLLVFEHKDWPEVARVALSLQRKGVNFYMEPWWQFMFGQRHQLTRLGSTPENSADIWWLTKPGEGGISIAPSLDLFTKPAPISPVGDEIRFSSGENGFRYVVLGSSAGFSDFTWTDLPRLVLVFVPEPAERDVRVIFDTQSARRGAKTGRLQPAVVFFNGREVGRVTAGERNSLSVVIPRDLWNSDPRGTLELRFPEAVLKHEFKRPRYDFWMAWGLWAIRFEPVSA